VTSRLGDWQPATLEERVDRMESLAAIQQLAYRYGLAVDSRDMDALVALFRPDVRVGPEHSGREALKEWYARRLVGFHSSIHFIGNHIVDFDGADRAHGVVYCRDELDRFSSGQWEVGTIQYWDTYVRVDGEWCFDRRRFHRWYIVDALERPAHGAGVDSGSGLSTHQLPEAYDTWHRFWQAAGEVSSP
jgi:hypothetical protein